MRSIEFKVWHEPSQRMYYVESFDKLNVYRLCDEGATDYELEIAANEPFNIKDCILLQYSDCNDVHGHKLWEADVVKLTHEKDNQDESHSFYVVVFHKGSFGYVPVGEINAIDESNFFILGDIAHLERQSNQYEHPELMLLDEFYPKYPKDDE